MRFPGAAIGPDAVLVWTGDRELTRFSRDGARASFTLPFTPLAARIGSDIVAVDDRGSVHRFTLAGENLGFLPLLESPGAITRAAVSADGSRVAILTDEVQVFAHGQLVPWSFEHRRHPGWRESGVDISADGKCLLVHYVTFGGMNLGDDAEGFSITRADGVVLFRYFAQKLPPLEISMTHDARLVAICQHENQVRLAETVSMAPLHRIEPVGHVQAMRFDGARLGVLFDYELVIVDRTETRLVLPEQFDDFVICGSDAVCVHPELGAWWIKTAAAD
ncbi:MAG: hypothetical protein M4D80_14750 [Myxococcota bacterium]|nr:hypothetical protein [Myxococcota bacterium]